MVDEPKIESREDIRVRLLKDVDFHLAKTKDGTALRVIFNVLREFLAEPPAKDYPIPPADAAVVNENSEGLNG